MKRSDRIRITNLLTVFLAAGTLSPVCPWTGAAAEEPVVAPVRITRVSLFKNGLGYVTSQTDLPGGATGVRFRDLPVPSFGTFWVAYPEDVPVVKLTARLESSVRETAVQDVRGLLAANPGARVSVLTGSETVVRGVLLGIERSQEEPDPVGPPGRSSPRDPREVSLPPGDLVLIRTDGGTTTAFPAHQIQRVEFLDPDSVTTVLRQPRRNEPVLDLELAEPAGGRPVTLTYLARGITWAPGYLIDLTGERTARFHARALVVNELADLEGVALDLVTGFPHVRFGDVSSPLAMNQSLAAFLSALGDGGRSAGGGMVMRQAVTANVAGFDDLDWSGAPSYSTAASGTTAEDLFLYPVEGFSLPRGETAWVPLFSAEMPYEHVYTWTVRDFLDESDTYRQTEEPGTETVWHTCRLTNTLEMPLTTAPAAFTTGGAFTGQDICTFTPPGGEASIRINRALSLLADQAEVEVGRTRNAQQFRGVHYDLVEIRGELQLKNRYDRAVQVEVTKELSGDVLETSPEAEDTVTAKGLKQINPRHVLTWAASLPAGEARTFTYRFRVYTRG